MCGRYVLNIDLGEIATDFDAVDSSEGNWAWEPTFNICPTQTVPVVAFDAQKRRKVVPMRWRLHAHWNRQGPKETKSAPLFNARLETASDKASFRTPWKRRRAIIPASHWYEWTGEQGGKIPWCIKPEHEPIFAFAGLWDQWRVDEGITLLSCTILTTQSDGPTSDLHHRMPVRLSPDHWDSWLDPDVNPDQTIANRQTGEDLIFWEVDRAVNSNRASGPELITPAV